MFHQRRVYLLLMAILLLFVMTACQQDQTPIEVTRIVEVEVQGEPVEVTRVVEVPVEVEVEAETAVANVPFAEQWLASPHADAGAEAFVHWNEDDPAEIPANCAKCHSTPGYLDFLGADGSAAGMVDSAAPIGSTVECVACHNEETRTKTSVVFPSGIEVMDLGTEARCMECHQGRASTETVNLSIADAGLAPEDLDTVSEDLGFTNIHYYAAAATQYGTLVMGGYEYDGKSYDARFDHVEPYNTCVDCHDAHTLEVRFEECTVCHSGLRDPEDLVDIRTAGSLVDYDGDGDMEEGVYFEIEDMRTLLYSAMQAYANEVAGTALVYESASYPYFFIDTNGNGEVDEGEAAFPNSFNAWTPRLAKAAYNYQVSLKDPGRYAHGGKYMIQLIYDSIEDLNAALAEPIGLSNARRIDHGHFAGSEEAFRHWDGEEDGGIVPASCSKCHTAEGLPFFLEEGVNISHPASNGFTCETCHADVVDFSLYKVETVTFPSGAMLSLGGDLDSNLCLNCHQGRQSKASVDASLAGVPDDQVGENLRFLNIHYFAAGATLFGTEAQSGYEYEGQEYVGRYEHVEAFDTCTECHNTHALEVEVEECSVCHEGVETAADLRDIRFNEEEVYVDFDGDGNVEEGIADEIATLQEQLYVAMQAYSANTAGAGILYSSAAYPYFFVDTNGDGVADSDEVNFGNRYVTWTPRLLRAAYNYQVVAKDPGGYAHNGDYYVQLLYDSLRDLGVNVAGFSRP